jgi:hypothetical protein
VTFGRHYWRRRLTSTVGERLAAVSCDPPGTIRMLSAAPRPALTWFDRLVSILTTPFKRIGISGWEETGCDARAGGSPVRDAQHSTDGFWTIDVSLAEFSIGPLEADLSSPRYLRLEVEPETPAHAICARTPVRQGAILSFAGAVVIDRDADFLEIHPDREFRIGA